MMYTVVFFHSAFSLDFKVLNKWDLCIISQFNEAEAQQRFYAASQRQWQAEAELRAYITSLKFQLPLQYVKIIFTSYITSEIVFAYFKRKQLEFTFNWVILFKK